MRAQHVSKAAPRLGLMFAVILLSIATVYAQVNDLTLHFLKAQQEKVHLQMMQGIAGNPWQYRILADWMISYLIAWLTQLDVARADVNSFIGFRFLQCLLIFGAAALYYRKLGLSIFAGLLGLSMLAWGMSYSLYNSDLSFNVFFDLAFYLIAAVLILNRHYIWILPLMVVAAFNRETSALIPIMMLAHAYFDADNPARFRSAVSIALAGLAVYALIFIGLRIHYGPQVFLTADGYYPGLGLLLLNLKRIVTWEQLLIAFGIIPVLSVLAYRQWARSLKIFFWTVVPLWLAVHFFAALVAETRLLLVPFALIFIPGALLGIVNDGHEKQPVE